MPVVPSPLANGVREVEPALIAPGGPSVAARRVARNSADVIHLPFLELWLDTLTPAGNLPRTCLLAELPDLFKLLLRDQPAR